MLFLLQTVIFGPSNYVEQRRLIFVLLFLNDNILVICSMLCKPVICGFPQLHYLMSVLHEFTYWQEHYYLINSYSFQSKIILLPG